MHIANDEASVVQAVRKSVAALPNKKGEHRVTILYNACMVDLQLQLLENGYNCVVRSQSGANITHISLPNLTFNGSSVQIHILQPVIIKGNSSGVAIESKEEWKQYQEAVRLVNEPVINVRNMSHLAESVDSVFNACGVTIPSGITSSDIEKLKTGQVACIVPI